MNKNPRLLLIVCILLAFSSCGQDAVSTSYYFPAGFNGEFIIIYGEKDGCPEKYEHGRRQLFIPKSGVLTTQFKFSDGFRDDVFFIQNEKGDYEKVKELLNPPNDSIRNQLNLDTSKFTSEKLPLTIMRGERIEVYNNRKEVRIVETGKLMSESYMQFSNKKNEDFIDNTLKKVEKGSVSQCCY